jgi:hypothetical protein
MHDLAYFHTQVPVCLQTTCLSCILDVNRQSRTAIGEDCEERA